MMSGYFMWLWKRGFGTLPSPKRYTLFWLIFFPYLCSQRVEIFLLYLQHINHILREEHSSNFQARVIQCNCSFQPPGTFTSVIRDFVHCDYYTGYSISVTTKMSQPHLSVIKTTVTCLLMPKVPCYSKDLLYLSTLTTANYTSICP